MYSVLRPIKNFVVKTVAQKYALLKSRLFLYSGEINTRSNQCISNDDITNQNPNEGANKAAKPVALIVRCLLTVVSVVTRQFGSLSIYLFMLIQNSLASTIQGHKAA